MTTDDTDRSFSEARIRAADWLIDLHTSDDLRALLPQFLAWLNTSPENRHEYAGMEKIWRALADLHDRGLLNDLTLHTPPAPLLDQHTNTGRSWSIPQLPLFRWHRLSIRAGLATCTAVVISAAIAFHIPTQLFVRPPVPCDICKLAHGSFAADVGHTPTLDLVDGSTISLSANTQVTLDMSTSHRSVQVQQGKALFRVSKNAAIPFDVRVGDTTVRVIGTTFSVENKGREGAATTVLEGAVMILTRNHTSGEVLHAGDSAEIDASGILLVHVSTSGLAERDAWASGRLLIDGQTLAEAAAAFNRINRRQIWVDAEIAHRVIEGVFASNDPEIFAKMLQEMGIGHYSLSRSPNTAVEIIHLRGRTSRSNSHDSPDNRNGLPGRH